MFNETTNEPEDTLVMRWLRLVVWSGLLGMTLVFWLVAGVAFLRWLF